MEADPSTGKPMNFTETCQMIERIYGVSIGNPSDRRGTVLDRQDNTAFADEMRKMYLGDKLLDNQDMCLLMGISKRTLARYRQKKLIRFYQISGRVWYKASEVADFLKKKGENLNPYPGLPPNLRSVVV